MGLATLHPRTDRAHRYGCTIGPVDGQHRTMAGCRHDGGLAGRAAGQQNRMRSCQEDQCRASAAAVESALRPTEGQYWPTG
jgi:hypothetical protein